MRCTKQQKKHYSGKQKCHTVKTQILVNTKTNEIICTAVSKGKVHDFKIWKESQIGIGKKIELLADKGYQGIKKVRIQVWRRGMREGIARSQEWAEIASRKKVIAERD